MTVIRVGTAEVHITPEGQPQIAFLAVIWAVNAECEKRGIPVIFGEPSKIDDNDWGGANTREVYEHADVVHVNGERARKADPTIRIVPKTDLAREIFDKVWPDIRERTALVQYAHNIPGVNLETLKHYQYLAKEA